MPSFFPDSVRPCEGGPFAPAHALVGLRDAPEYGNHEAEGQLDSGARYGTHRVQVRRCHAHEHARLRGGGHVDVIRVVASLRDELQLRQRLEEGCIEPSALAQCDQYRVTTQPLERQFIGVHVDRDAAAQTLNRRVGPEDAMVVVQHCDPHVPSSFRRYSRAGAGSARDRTLRRQALAPLSQAHDLHRRLTTPASPEDAILRRP